MLPEAYDDPESRYEEWKDELFVEDGRVLRGPVHIEMVPYFNKDITEAEEIMIRVASKI